MVLQKKIEIEHSKRKEMKESVSIFMVFQKKKKYNPIKEKKWKSV